MLKRLTIHLNLRTYTMLLALVSIWVIFTVITDGTFISSRNLSNLSRQTSVTAILSIGMVLIIVSGNIDLSVGFGSGLLGAIVAVIHVWFDQSVLVAMLIALLIGILIGILHGFLIAYQRVPAFIVTLGGFMVYRGLMLAITHDETIMLPNGWLKMLGNSYLPKSVGWILGSVNIHSSLVSSMVIGG
ncbi:TPA: sugar ABC transporter permease, partial [Candidatus Poribacteria bacterium]|nr:sugar ABC transporter permease [Candidatus Poribacteria bacterium]